MKKQIVLSSLLSLVFTACTTVPKQDQTVPPVSQPIPSPNPVEPPAPNPEPLSGGDNNDTGTDEIIEGPSNPPINTNTEFNKLTGWNEVDLRPALISFQRSCEKIIDRDTSEELLRGSPFYGRVSDWYSPCIIAKTYKGDNQASARNFFESEFLPVSLSDGTSVGTVTGYYQPEISVSKIRTDIYSEAILSTPSNSDVLTWPRSKIIQSNISPIAYGKPIDVFFMQIQGSGVLVFNDGVKLRAAYANNNGYPYTSIGRVLIERGELSKDQASKQDIEAWMAAAGKEKSRALMNENARYIFFKEEQLVAGEGPKGAMRVPLTDMASIAVDPKHYPYGLPVWLETKIPFGKGDYKGQDTSLLAISQDTGKAIRGEYRADLYFGSGFTAGDKAGVMKHTARWTVLLPFHLALQLASIS